MDQDASSSKDMTVDVAGGQSLESFFQVSSPATYQLMARPGNNLGNPTLIFSIPMAEFSRLSIIANEPTAGAIAQRKLDVAHATKLAVFMLKGLVNAARMANAANGAVVPDATFEDVLHKMGPQPYSALQPLVVNIRSAGPRGSRLAAKHFPEGGPAIGVSVFLGQRDLLYVIDGQHRRFGIDLVLKFLDEVRRTHTYPKAKASLFPYGRDTREAPQDELAVWEKVYETSRSLCTVAAEAHLGLDVEQERQLFHDLNNLTKKVEVSLALEFDSSNPVNQFIKSSLIGKLVTMAAGDKVDWNSPNTGAMTRKDLVAVNSHLFLNKSNINGASAAAVDAGSEVATRFWEAVNQCDGFGDTNARDLTVLAQPVMLKALAKLTYDFAFGRKGQRNEEHLTTLLDGITNLDFSHENPVWRFYEMTEEERVRDGIAGLATYLSTSQGNRDIGAFDPATGKMRFGAKHNDIFPILGDMVRFQLGLPSRHATTEPAVAAPAVVAS